MPQNFFLFFLIVNSKMPENNYSIILPWGNYGDGTYDLSAPIQRYALARILIGYSGKNSILTVLGQANDYTNIQTEDGMLQIAYPTTTSISVTGAKAGTTVREIIMYPNFKLPS